MRAVNLLPEGERAARPVQQANGAKVVLGVLAGLVLVVLAFVATQNQINGRSGDIARANDEARSADARASQLSAFGNFAQIKQTRVSSVSQLADSRFDWERFMRELALVLPSGTSLLQANGSVTGEDAASGSAPSSSSTSAPAPSSGSAAASSSSGSSASAGASPSAGSPAGGSPSVTLTGCAKTQQRVAVLMVRLRQMYRATDVTLADSTKGTSGPGGGSSTGSSDSASGQGDNSDCAPGLLKFQTTVTFEAAPTPKPNKQRSVPSRLGGGA